MKKVFQILTAHFAHLRHSQKKTSADSANTCVGAVKVLGPGGGDPCEKVGSLSGSVSILGISLGKDYIRCYVLFKI